MPVEQTSPIVEGLTQSIPVPKAPAEVQGWRRWLPSKANDERNQLERDGSQSHNIRRIAAYGALLLALVLYCGGVCAIGVFLGLVPGIQPASPGMWQIVVAVLVALFTVPTLLVLAVLRMASPAKQDTLPTSIQEALGQMVQKVFDKLSS